MPSDASTRPDFPFFTPYNQVGRMERVEELKLFNATCVAFSWLKWIVRARRLHRKPFHVWWISFIKDLSTFKVLHNSTQLIYLWHYILPINCVMLISVLYYQWLSHTKYTYRGTPVIKVCWHFLVPYCRWCKEIYWVLFSRYPSQWWIHAVSPSLLPNSLCIVFCKTTFFENSVLLLQDKLFSWNNGLDLASYFL